MRNKFLIAALIAALIVGGIYSGTYIQTHTEGYIFPHASHLIPATSFHPSKAWGPVIDVTPQAMEQHGDGTIYVVWVNGRPYLQFYNIRKGMVWRVTIWYPQGPGERIESVTVEGDRVIIKWDTIETKWKWP